jgi:hypothetical protein
MFLAVRASGGRLAGGPAGPPVRQPGGAVSEAAQQRRARACRQRVAIIGTLTSSGAAS